MDKGINEAGKIFLLNLHKSSTSVSTFFYFLGTKKEKVIFIFRVPLC